MSAVLELAAPAAPVHPRRRGRANGRPRASAPAARRPRGQGWYHVPAAASCVDKRPTLTLVVNQPTPAEVPVEAVAAAPEYVWTERGIAVLVLLALCLFTVMGGVLMHSFLAVSNEPLISTASSAVAWPLGWR